MNKSNWRHEMMMYLRITQVKEYKESEDRFYKTFKLSRKRSVQYEHKGSRNTLSFYLLVIDRNTFSHSEGAWSYYARQKADRTPNCLPLGAANRQVKDLPSGCVSTRRGAELSPEPCLFWAITLKMYTVAGIKFWIVTCISPGWLVFSTRSLWIKKGFWKKLVNTNIFR